MLHRPTTKIAVRLVVRVRNLEGPLRCVVKLNMASSLVYSRPYVWRLVTDKEDVQSTSGMLFGQRLLDARTSIIPRR